MTLGADTQYQDAKFIGELRKRTASRRMSASIRRAAIGWKNVLREAERSDPGGVISQKKRKLIERVFGWSKLGSAAQTDQAARTAAGGLVLSTCDHGLQSETHGRS